MDETISISSLKNAIRKFRSQRNWLKTDTPKNLAISISVEAAELLEHFQWKNDREISEALEDQARLAEISNELADVIIYCIGFSDVLGIDISNAIQSKLGKNEEKYPAIKTTTAAL